MPLLADEGLEVARSYGVTGWIGPLGKLARLEGAVDGRYVMRATFVIDGEGIVRHRHVSRTGAAYQSADDIERAVAAIA